MRCVWMVLFLSAVCQGAESTAWATARAGSKPRLIVLTDIGGDPDDQQSMIRLMTYSNEFQIEGLIATASGTPGELKERVTKPQLIREIVDAYGQVRENLARHAEGYPTAKYLRDRIKSGNPQRGVKAIGKGHDTQGSRWIISVVDQSDPRPVNVTIWGGQTDLAQALWRVRADRGEKGLKEFAKRIRIYDIADQDGIADWILQEFPSLFYVLAKAPKGRDKREATFRGMYLGGDESLTSRKWIDENIRTGHGPLGALYPTRTWTAPNPHSAIKEGDTPSWFHFLSVGLSDPERPDWGGWGGRFQRNSDGVWRDAHDTVDGVTDARTAVWRWRDAFQRDFEARMDWCVKTPEEANHPPKVVCEGNTQQVPTVIHITAGDEIRLDAAGSRDPDGDALMYRWWIYKEPGDCNRLSELRGDDSPRLLLKVPAGASGNSHVILEVTDSGRPPLTRYRRVVVAID